jgi:hypothetical protein
VGKPPSAPPPSTTSLDPVNIGPDQTLSGGNLTVTNNVGGNGIARSIANHSSGKYYAEVTFNVASNVAVGFVSGTDSLSAFLEGVGVGTGYSNGIWGGSVSGTTTAPPISYLINGHVFGIAVDVGNRAAWIKDITAGSLWNADATADPASNVHGAILGGSVGTGAIFLAETVGNVTDSMTFNFGATSYVGTPPAGFGNW